MAIKSVTLALNGQTYTIPLDSSGKYTKSITAPSTSSYSQTDNVYAMVLSVEDTAGNVTTVNKNHATYGAAMKLRVKEKVAPTIVVNSPGANAYLTSNTVSFSIDVTDSGSGVSSSSITATLNGTALSLTKTAITNGYRCTYTGTVADGANHSLVVNASDNDGNTASKTVSFVVDTVPPSLNVTAPANALVTNQQSCTVSGTTNDATSGLASVRITLNGADQGTITVASNGTFSKAVTLASGSNTIVVTATDKAGKASSLTRTVTYDPNAPVIVSVTVAPNPVDAGATFTVTVEATD